jgi:hypothetical protein
MLIQNYRRFRACAQVGELPKGDTVALNSAKRLDCVRFSGALDSDASIVKKRR